MNLIEKKYPGKKYTKREATLIEFMRMNVPSVQVNWHEEEYKDNKSAQGVLYQCIKRNGYPIRVRMHGDELYLLRTDM